MVMKTAGIGLVLAGMVNTGMGVLGRTENSQVVVLVGFGVLIFGTALYLSGATQEFFEERQRERDRECSRKNLQD